MNIKRKSGKYMFASVAVAFAAALMLGLSGCGGSGSDATVAGGGTVTGDGGGSGGTISKITLSGAVATGAAFTGAVVTVLDSKGVVVATSSPVGEDGTFSVTLSDGAVGPFVLVASRTTADGEVQSLVSVSASDTSGTANITQISNLIAARLSTLGDPTKLASELASGAVQITSATVAAAVTEVKTILAPLLEATGTTAIDPLTGTFLVNGTGYDRLLDSVSILIVPTSTTTSNIQISVNQTQVDGATPTVISFSSTATEPPTLPAVDSTSLVESGTSVLIADFLKQLTSCYALPVTQRVPSGTTAADIQAAECKNSFYLNDPTTYKSNGSVVGKGKAFNGIFVDGATGVVFSQGTYEFTRGNGDLVIGYKSRDIAGNEDFNTFAVRKDTDSKLKLIGNQYAYPGGISAYHQRRQFITLGQSAFDYYSTGYAPFVIDVKGGTGVGGSIFDRIVVTAPGGTRTVVLKPSSGSSILNLVLPGQTTPSGTSYIRLRSEYVNSATTGHPSQKDTKLFFVPTDFTESELSQLPENSVWRFDYFLTGNTSSTPNETQYYKTRSRALTIAELKQKGLADLTPAVIQQLVNGADVTTGQIVLPTANPINGVDFTVPTGALPVTGIKIFGRYIGTGFDDNAIIGSTTRTGTVRCSPASNSDFHCSTTVPGAFASGAYGNGLHLYAKDSNGREYANFYASYKLQ